MAKQVEMPTKLTDTPATRCDDGRDTVLNRFNELMQTLDGRLQRLEQSVANMAEMLQSRKPEKEWYTTAEVAELLGKKDYTIREKWCHRGRIKAEKDPATGRWRIPGDEVQRLLKGGPLLDAED
ncbi:MAG: helix-turn-helix domain-containing protein [Thermoguttaceae bacterium]